MNMPCAKMSCISKLAPLSSAHDLGRGSAFEVRKVVLTLYSSRKKERKKKKDMHLSYTVWAWSSVDCKIFLLLWRSPIQTHPSPTSQQNMHHIMYSEMCLCNNIYMHMKCILLLLLQQLFHVSTTPKSCPFLLAMH